MKVWHDLGLVDLVVCVNVSPVQFHRNSIELDITNALDASGLQARHLELELTESLPARPAFDDAARCGVQGSGCRKWFAEYCASQPSPGSGASPRAAKRPAAELGYPESSSWLRSRGCDEYMPTNSATTTAT